MTAPRPSVSLTALEELLQQKITCREDLLDKLDAVEEDIRQIRERLA